MYDCRIVEEFGDLWLAFMGVGKVFMNCTTVAVPLLAALQGGGSEPNIVYIATLTSVVRTSKVIHYIGLMLMGLPWCCAVTHKERGCEVWFAISSQYQFLVRCYWRGASFDDTAHRIALLLVVGTERYAMKNNQRIFGIV